jgi:hypothetical protein
MLGGLGGWVVGLHVALWRILDPVLWKTAGILPATAGRIDAVWTGRLESVVLGLLQRTKGIARWLILRIVFPRIRTELDKYEQAVERYRLKQPGRILSSQMLSYAALSHFLRPIWFFFYVAYGVMFLGWVVFLGIPFIR